jgi:8-oxo-dGTP pyrophosphatase MutT (NUDIX family)
LDYSPKKKEIKEKKMNKTYTINTETKSAALCPIRLKDDNLEVLLTRRSFWNVQKRRPMRYPGEWVFAGGIYEEKDRDLQQTAEREFREELGYLGEIKDQKFLRSANLRQGNKDYAVHFYSALIEEEPIFRIYEGGEVIDIKWMRPECAIKLIQSKEFSEDQLEQFEQRKLGDNKYGIYAARKRSLPIQNIKTLEQIYSFSREEIDYRRQKQ